MPQMLNKNPCPIKVCFVLPKTYPLFNPECTSRFGGAEVDLYYLSTALAKDPAFDVSCIVGDFGQPPIEHEQNVTLIRSVNLNKNPISGGLRLWRALQKANANIYLTKTPSLGFSLIDCFCRIYKRKFAYRIAHIRETDGSYRKEHPILGRAFVRSLKNANLVFAQNQEDLARLKKLFGVSAIAIPNGHRIPPLPDNPRDTILWVGRSATVKRPELFLKLAKEFPQQQFIMICQKATEDNNYQQLIKQTQAIPNLEFIKGVSFHETTAYFQRAKLFVSTSDSEGFPNTFIQACLAATPILSLTVNPDNFLNQHKCGLCANADWATFQNMLKQMLKPTFASEFSNNARQYAQDQHDVDTIVLQYKNIFQKLINP